MMTESTNYSRDIFTMGQIRLSELSVYNWGSFHGLHSARIDPEALWSLAITVPENRPLSTP